METFTDYYLKQMGGKKNKKYSKKISLKLKNCKKKNKKCSLKRIIKNLNL